MRFEIHVSQIPRAHPSAPESRARDTYPRRYSYVTDMYRECILCVMYLRVSMLRWTFAVWVPFFLSFSVHSFLIGWLLEYRGECERSHG